MKIVLVGPAHPYKGGGARHTTELAHRLASAGHDVVIESWRSQYPRRLYPGQQTVSEAEGALFAGTRRRLAWYRPDGWFAAGRRLRSADLVVFALLTPIQVPSYLFILFGLGRRRSTVVICHNVLPHERRPGDVVLVRGLLHRVGAVLVHSEDQAKLARSLVPNVRVSVAAMPPHLPVIPLDVPPDCTAISPHPQARPHELDGQIPKYPAASSKPRFIRWKSGAKRKLRVRKRPLYFRVAPIFHRNPASAHLGATVDGGVRLLFFGIVRPYKGLDVLLRALAGAPSGVTLTVAGEFWGGAVDTERLIAELGIGGRVTLRPGYVPASEIPELFAAADALVLPYREATASQNALLAFAHGVPVITTTAGSLAAQVRDGVDGITVAPGSVDDLVGALRSITEPGALARLRAGVRVPDRDQGWDTYLSALVSSVRS